MADLTSVGVTSGVPSSGTGTVATINQLINVGSPISNGSTSAPVLVNISGASSTVTSSMSALNVALSPNSAGLTISSITSGTVVISSGTLASLSSGSVVISNGNNQAQVLAGSSTVTSTMSGLVAVLSPNSAGIITTGTAGSPSSVVLSVQGVASGTTIPVTPADQYSQYETVAASQSSQVMGATGAAGDYLAGVLVFPGTAGCGVVTIVDNATTIGTFAGGGTTALPSLVPFLIPVGLFSVSGAWKITTGANVTAVGIGKFT